MKKQVILVTGTPKTGKTTTSKLLIDQLKAEYINLTELALKEKLTLRRDTKRNTTIINPTKMRKRLTEIIEDTHKQTVIIDGHYAATVTPKTLVTYTIVLRKDPQRLRPVMQKAGYDEAKTDENIAAEILDTSLFEALNNQNKTTICEIDTTNKTPREVTNEILAIIHHKQKCHIGTVDWLTKLENEGKLDEYLKI
jgi:adenylate kinase